MKQHIVTIVDGTGLTSSTPQNPTTRPDKQPWAPEDYIVHAIQARRRSYGGSIPLPLTITYHER